MRRWWVMLAILAAGVLLPGCRDTAAPTPARPPAKLAPKPPPATDPTTTAAPARAPHEVLRQAVVVEPNKPASAGVLLHAGQRYIVYAGPMDPRDPADPHLTIRNHRGELIGESASFRNDLFAAVPLALDYDSQASIEVGCDEHRGGSISLRVQELGQLAAGQSIEGVLADFQAFAFYAVDAAADQRFEAATAGLAQGGDTLLTIHHFDDLAIIAENDDVAADDTASEVLWHAHAAGPQVIAVTSWTQDGTGSYTLSLTRLQAAGG